MKNDILSGNDVCQILHISKRKCAWMLQNGMIPCEDTGKKTRRYLIRREDLDEYIRSSTAFPEEYLMPRIFTAKSKTPRPAEQSVPVPPPDYREWLSDLWYQLPDVLASDDIQKATGYRAVTVQNWISQRKLRSVNVQGSIVIAREWLIDFFCGYGWRIVRKSKRHQEILKRYYVNKIIEKE